MLRPVPNERPNANPVRSCRLPGRTPRFDTLPYENPPFNATLPCAGATVVTPSAVAMRQANVRVMVKPSLVFRELHPVERGGSHDHRHLMSSNGTFRI